MLQGLCQKRPKHYLGRHLLADKGNTPFDRWPPWPPRADVASRASPLVRPSVSRADPLPGRKSRSSWGVVGNPPSPYSKSKRYVLRATVGRPLYSLLQPCLHVTRLFLPYQQQQQLVGKRYCK